MGHTGSLLHPFSFMHSGFLYPFIYILFLDVIISDIRNKTGYLELFTLFARGTRPHGLKRVQFEIATSYITRRRPECDNDRNVVNIDNKAYDSSPNNVKIQSQKYRQI